MHLCEQDTGSSAYLGLADGLTAQCESSCQATALAAVTNAEWACMFTASCRECFGNDSKAGAQYTCKSGSAMASFPPGAAIR